MVEEEAVVGGMMITSPVGLGALLLGQAVGQAVTEDQAETIMTGMVIAGETVTVAGGNLVTGAAEEALMEEQAAVILYVMVTILMAITEMQRGAPALVTAVVHLLGEGTPSINSK